MSTKLKDDPELADTVRGALWTKNREKLETWLLNRDVEHCDEGIHSEARQALALEHIAWSINDVATALHNIARELKLANTREDAVAKRLKP